MIRIEYFVRLHQLPALLTAVGVCVLIMLMVNANLKEKMLRFQIPSELKDDLVYCQRSLRHFVKVHQVRF